MKEYFLLTVDSSTVTIEEIQARPQISKGYIVSTQSCHHDNSDGEDAAYAIGFIGGAVGILVEPR